MSMAKTRKKPNPKPPSTTEAIKVPPKTPVLQDNPGVEVEVRSVEVPFVVPVIGYVTNRVDTGHTLSESQKNNLRRIQNGLIEESATLENGKPVKTGADAIKWILESVG